MANKHLWLNEVRETDIGSKRLRNWNRKEVTGLPSATRPWQLTRLREISSVIHPLAGYLSGLRLASSA
jgi:hypothetical protein